MVFSEKGIARFKRGNSFITFASMEKQLIYFDNAASSPLDERVLRVMHTCQRELFGNPSSVHEAGRRARVAVEDARRTIAKRLHVTPAEVFFTSGGTEANNAILWGAAEDLGYSSFITSPAEHPAVLKPLEAIGSRHGVRVHFAAIDNKGHVDLDHLEKLLKENPASVVSLMHANNETGTLLPVKAVSGLCAKYDSLFHSDTVQTIGKFEMNLGSPHIDFAVASAHKFHGPKGAGFMIVRSGNFFKPFLTGGGQERNMRAGTENLCGIVGMAEALELAHERLEEDQRHIMDLKKTCIENLSERVPGVSFNGDAEGSSLHTILNLSLPAGIDPDMLLPRLDMEYLRFFGQCLCFRNNEGLPCAGSPRCGSAEAIAADLVQPLQYP